MEIIKAAIRKAYYTKTNVSLAETFKKCYPDEFIYASEWYYYDKNHWENSDGDVALKLRLDDFYELISECYLNEYETIIERALDGSNDVDKTL